MCSSSLRLFSEAMIPRKQLFITTPSELIALNSLCQMFFVNLRISVRLSSSQCRYSVCDSEAVDLLRVIADVIERWLEAGNLVAALRVVGLWLRRLGGDALAVESFGWF